jgi:hypothetical protein
MIFTAGLSMGLSTRNLAPRFQLPIDSVTGITTAQPPNLNSKFNTMALSLFSSLLIWAPSFCWLSGVFRLALMVLDPGRASATPGA